MLGAAENAKITGAEEMPIKPLIVFGGALSKAPVSILKDDGCNANVASKSFFEKHKEIFDSTEDANAIMHHSDQSIEEKGALMLKEACIQIGGHTRRSNFAVADCRHDALLGMPWHVENEPSANYKDQAVTIGECILRASDNTDPVAEIQNISVKKFRRMCRKKKGAVFCLKINSLLASDKKLDGRANIPDPRLAAIVEAHSEIFKSELPPGLPPKRDVEHEIIIDADAKMPSRRLCQLSPQE